MPSRKRTGQFVDSLPWHKTSINQRLRRCSQTLCSYTFGPATQTATISTTVNNTTTTQWKRTTFDGFGRTIKVETGHDGTTYNTMDTVYGACGCSPLGKVVKVSMPYAAGETAYVEGDPINFVYPQGLFLLNPCAEDPTQVGCGPDDPPVKDPDPGGGGPGGGGGGSRPPPSANPCSFGSLSPQQQGLMSPSFAANWGNASMQLQQEFVDITSDAAALGVP